MLVIPLLLLGQVSLRIAPERNLPHSYADEPLLIEIVGVPSGEYEVSGSISDPRANVTLFELGPQTFHEDTSVYVTVPHKTDTAGRHELTLDVNK